MGKTTDTPDRKLALAAAMLACLITLFTAIVIFGTPPDLLQGFISPLAAITWCFAPCALIAYIVARTPRGGASWVVGWLLIGVAMAGLFLTVRTIATAASDPLVLALPFYAAMVVVAVVLRILVEPFHLPPWGGWRAAAVVSTSVTAASAIPVLHLWYLERTDVSAAVGARGALGNNFTAILVAGVNVLIAVLAALAVLRLGLWLGGTFRRARGLPSSYVSPS